MNTNNILIIPIITSCLFCISKYLEMKYIDKDIKPLKTLIRDTLIVFITSLTATYFFFHMNGFIEELMNVITDNKTLSGSIFTGGNDSAQIFTEPPNF